MNVFGQILPSEFIPQLRENVPVIRIEGGEKDYDLPEIEDGGVDFYEDIYPPSNQSNPSRPVTSGDVSEWQKKYQEIQRELNLIKDEHKSNLKDLKLKIDEYETQVQFKGQQFKDLQAK